MNVVQCPTCGHDSEDIYRCEECQKDLVEDKETAGDRR